MTPVATTAPPDLWFYQRKYRIHERAIIVVYELGKVRFYNYAGNVIEDLGSPTVCGSKAVGGWLCPGHGEPDQPVLK